jgi:unsaturated chondroitin disaccharide hydrolase
MFYGMAHHYAGFRAYDATGDRRLFGLGLDGADAMVDSFHEGARQIPLGDLKLRGPENFRGPESDHGPSGDRVGAVDNVYTALPVLWRAYRETGDARFRDIAVSHADRHLDWYVRPDGSTWHHAVFDAETGNLERQYNELAHADDTCWARGQGWNVAGLARTYRETGAGRYLDALERTVAYYVAESPADLVAYWDFAAPQGSETPRDTSAAALVAYGLVRLDPESVPRGHADRVADLRRTGERVLAALIADYLITDAEDDRYGMVKHGCYNYPGGFATDNELVWTDYYVAEAVSALLAEH